MNKIKFKNIKSKFLIKKNYEFNRKKIEFKNKP